MDVKGGSIEELIAWRKARALTRNIYVTSREGSLSDDYGLRDQIRRAAVSTMSNIAEGHARGGRSEFHQFLTIAMGSNGEVRSQLYVAFDAGYLTEPKLKTLLDQTEELSRILHGLRRTVRIQRDRRKT